MEEYPGGDDMRRPIRVGIVGASMNRGWAVTAHLPGLRAMDAFAVTAVATTRQETADETAAAYGVPNAYADWRALVTDPDVDLVAVCVKVRFHREIVLAAVEAGKHVFCEWPLGLNLAEAEEMHAAATARGVANLVGLQGRASPTINLIRNLVAEGAIGKVISATLVSSLDSHGPVMQPFAIYRTQIESGASALMIPGGHSLDSLCRCVGGFRDVAATVTTQHRRVQIAGTDDVVDATAPDQVLVNGTLENGAVAVAHVKADIANPNGVRLEINGTDGDIVATTPEPVPAVPLGIHRSVLTVRLARGRGAHLEEVAVPADLSLAPAGVTGPSFYTAQLYARLAASLAEGAALDPDFGAAVRHHRLMDAVQAASDTGQRQIL